MKLFFGFSLMLFFSFGYGQTYNFDKLIKAKFSTKYFPNQESSNLCNTKDYSYHMQFYSQNDTLKTRIFDSKTNKIHFFNVVKTDSFRLKYLKTISVENSLNFQSYEFSDIKIKRGKKTIRLTIFNKSKEKIITYKLTIEDDDQDYFTAFKLFGGLHPYESLNIVPPFNFRVLESNISNYKLQSIDAINISITIP